MSKLTDEQMDSIIKSEFKKDNVISEKADSVFKNFDPKMFAKQETKNTSNDVNKINKAGNKVIEVDFYKRLNRILSVAAVSLSVVLVGGTALYFGKNSRFNTDNNNQTITINEKSLVKNEKLELSNEKILKEVEHGYVKVYLLGKKDVGINLTSRYWNEVGVELVSTDCYKVDNISKNVSDIFIGEITDSGVPYVFLVMEDGTAEYIDLHHVNGEELQLTTQEVQGLYDVIGFEQKTRKFSYSNTDYRYVNAIRKDGLRKEIEIGVVNNWNDNVSENFNSLNEKYIKAHNKEAIVDDGKGDFSVDNASFFAINGENEFMYCIKNNSLYRIRKRDYNEERIAAGITGMARNYADGRVSVYVGISYEIYSLDKNIVFKNSNEQVINEVTGKKDKVPQAQVQQDQTQVQQAQTQVQDNGDYSTFSALAGSSYRNANVKYDYSDTTYDYEIKFDENGKPTIKISALKNGKVEELFETTKVTNINSDVAAGTLYVSFDFAALASNRNTNGSAQMKISNVDENNEIGFKTKVWLNGVLQQFNNKGDFVYMNKVNNEKKNGGQVVDDGVN